MGVWPFKEQELRIFGIVLIPGVVQGIADPRHRQRRNEAELNPHLWRKYASARFDVDHGPAANRVS